MIVSRWTPVSRSMLRMLLPSTSMFKIVCCLSVASTVIPIYNSGSTPGIVYQAGAKMFIATDEADISRKVQALQEEGKLTDRETAISPGLTSNFNHDSDVFVSADLTKALDRGAATICLYGMFKYRDVSKQPHTTWFCMTYDYPDGGFIQHKDYGHMD